MVANSSHTVNISPQSSGPGSAAQNQGDPAVLARRTADEGGGPENKPVPLEPLGNKGSDLGLNQTTFDTSAETR